MPRGQASKIDSTFTNANGYHYTRTESGWRPTHHLIAEEILGRRIDKETELVRFKDGNRANLDPLNITVTKRPNKRSKEARIAQIEAKIADLQAELELLLKE